MAVIGGGSSAVTSLPPPRPKSPPQYPDLYGKKRDMAKVIGLEREIGFLEDELKSVAGQQPASRCCKEVAEFVVANSDPLIPRHHKTRRSCRFWKWLCKLSSCFRCSSCSQTCCNRCSLELNLPSCCHCKSCSCPTFLCCSLPNLKCCCFPRSCCLKKSSCCRSCAACQCPSCTDCSSCISWSCSCPKCLKLRSCCSCTKSCCNPCFLRF